MRLAAGRDAVGADHALLVRDDALDVGLVHREEDGDGARRIAQDRARRLGHRQIERVGGLAQRLPFQLRPPRHGCQQHSVGIGAFRLGDEGAEDGAGCRVRVNVERHVLAGGASLLNVGDRVTGPAPAPGAARLVVRNLRGQPGLKADSRCLLHRFHQPLTLVADVADVETALCRGFFRALDDLVGLGETAGRVDQPCREADRARRHPLAHVLAHRVKLFRRGRARVHADRRVAHDAVRDEAGDVDRRPHLLDRRHVLAERPPLSLADVAQDHADRRHGSPLRVVGRDAGAAVADDVGRHALHQLEVHRRRQHRGVVVRVDVDEARRNDASRGVDLPRRLLATKVTDRGDPPAADRDVRPGARRPRAVEDGAAGDQEVVGLCGHSVEQRIAPGAAVSTKLL